MLSQLIKAMLELMRDWFAQVNHKLDHKFEKLEKLIVMNFEQLNTKVDELTGKVTSLQTATADAGTALANEIAVVNEVIAELRANAGSGISPEQADALALKLDGVSSNIDAVKTAVDAAAAAANQEANDVKPPTP